MSRLKSNKEKAIERFDFAKKQGLDLIEEINQYVKGNNCFESPFMQGYTFRAGLDILEQEQSQIFNNNNRNTIMQSDENNSELDFIIKKIEEQINHHGEIRIGLNIYFKNRN